MLPDWPIYFKNRLIVENLESCVGVVTLWMPKETVASVLPKDSYCVCGQLYTKRGINPLIRNILANPKIRYLVMCGVDRQASGVALKNFFEKGISKDSEDPGQIRGWRIVDDAEAVLDKEISLKALNLVRENVKLFDLRTKTLEELIDLVVSLKQKKSFSEPQVFPEPKIHSHVQYPSDASVFKVRREYIGDAWLDALKLVQRFGSEIPGMYGKVKAIQNLSIVVEKEEPSEPKFFDFFRFNKDSLDSYIKGFLDKNKKGTEDYTYGERIFDWDGVNQEETMVQKLRGFSYDRGALCVLWKPHIDNFPSKTKGKTVPCLVMILGQCINDNFHMTAVFRNNDIYGAWPLNTFALRSFQKDIAKKIGMGLGVLTTISHIAEVYENDYEICEKIIEKNDNLARTCKFDPRSNFEVEVKGESILVSFYSPDGSQLLASYAENGKKPKVARDLCAMALRDELLSEIGAACDFGRQLAKAEAAVKLNLKFEQDQSLKL